MKCEFRFLSVEVLKASPTNPRKKFDREKLAELSESIKERGILSPILVRPIPTESIVCYEIVAGERRWRAAKEASKKMVPCNVTEMTDAEVLEAQMIENLQRDDLEPLEEAKGFKLMLDLRTEMGDVMHTVESVASRIGKSARYVHRRLKLLNLPLAGLSALELGRIDVSIGEILGRIPDLRLRERAVKEVLEPKGYDRPLTCRETQALIESRYMRTLQGCGFSQEDPTLHPEGVICSTCPQRAGNNPDIEGVRGDMCLDPLCFERKAQTSFERWKAAHAGEGKRVLTPEENRKIISDDRIVEWSTKLVAVEEPPQPYLLNAVYADKMVPKWRELIEGRGVEIVIAKKSDDTALECVDLAAATEAAKLNGHNIFKATSRDEVETFKREQKHERERIKARWNAFKRLLISSSSSEIAVNVCLADLVKLALEGLLNQGQVRLLIEARGESVRKILKWLPTADEASLSALALQVSICARFDSSDGVGADLRSFLKTIGADLSAFRKELKTKHENE